MCLRVQPTVMVLTPTSFIVRAVAFARLLVPLKMVLTRVRAVSSTGLPLSAETPVRSLRDCVGKTFGPQ